MSLFNLIQWEIIENPRATNNYRRIVKQKEETEEERKKRRKAEWKAISNDMKVKLSEEEFNKWRVKAYYEWQREEKIKKVIDRYYRKKAEEEAMIEEIYKDVYDPLPEPIDYDKYYLEKFKEDDTDVDGKYRFSWRSSKIVFQDWKAMKRYKKPIKICYRRWLNRVRNTLLREEWKAYQLLLPYLSDLEGAKFMIKRKQTITKYPLWNVKWLLAKLIINSDIAPSHVCNVLSAIQRGKYIVSEAYLWRNSFIMWDIIVTQTGHKFQPCLEHNIRWLNPKTVDDIHNVRMKRRKKKWKVAPPIYMLQDAYLVKITPNEWEQRFYIIPT